MDERPLPGSAGLAKMDRQVVTAEFYGFILFMLLLLFWTEQVGEGERWRARTLSRIHAQQGAQHGARSHGPELMT